MIVNEQGIRQAEQGDMIECFDRVTERTIRLTIREVISCDDYGPHDEAHPDRDWGFYIEFIANETGMYGYWKQQWDGGYLIPKQ